LTIRLTASRLPMVLWITARTFNSAIRAACCPCSISYQWVLQQRILLAQRLLETTNEPIERVAGRCGFRSAATFRLHFHRFLSTKMVP
jgi:transcriptional regulator GlxA family with amidase domain